MTESAESRPDPLYQRSFSWPMAVGIFLLLASTIWAFWDEFVTRRPYKAIQDDFVRLYEKRLKTFREEQQAKEREIVESAEYQAIQARLEEAEQRVAAERKPIEDELRNVVTPAMAAISDDSRDWKSLVAARAYRLEHHPVGSDARRKAIDDLAEIKNEKREIAVEWPGFSSPFTYDELMSLGDEIRGRKAELQRKLGEVSSSVAEIRRERDAYLSANLTGLNAAAIDGLLAKLQDFDYGIRQTNLAQGMVDRCETCHLGAREPVPLTAENMGGTKLFVNHQNADLIATHDPEKFGCGLCHGGNGVAVTSVERGHGRHEYWLWPMHHPENVEAGCVQCHGDSLVLEHADTLNEGREVYRRVCSGCHAHASFDRDAAVEATIKEDELALAAEEASIRAKLLGLETEERPRVSNLPTDNDRQMAEQDRAFARLNEAEEKLRLGLRGVETRRIAISVRKSELDKEKRRIGPDLFEVRRKLVKGWIPVWLEDPQKFRAGTRMPHFRLTETQIHAISAYLWQNATTEALTAPPVAGDAARGLERFQERGCLGCHTTEREVDRVVGYDADGYEIREKVTERLGDGFAADLSRIGEKADATYLYHWVRDPKQLDPRSVMPNLRLSEQEAADIAAYLMTLKSDDAAAYTAPPQMDDADLAADGKAYLRHFGCAGCHDIPGLMEETRIGTELTTWASKPHDRLDFGQHTRNAQLARPPLGDLSALHGFEVNQRGGKRAKWYDAKGFAELKLRRPEIFDHGRQIADELGELRMPKIYLGENDEQIDAVVTLLLGSVDSRLPPELAYEPSETQAAIREGWWLVKKYNCVGCHQLQEGVKPALWSLPRFQDGFFRPGGTVAIRGETDRPPSLVGQGFRTDPAWLAQFLRDPSLGAKGEASHANGARLYVDARMPTFDFSEREIQILVRFFEAMALRDVKGYQRPVLEPLTAEELPIAREAFAMADCIKCHRTEDALATAPSFVHSRTRLRPEWIREWVIDPSALMPGTTMPTGLFRYDRENERWVTAGEMPDALRAYDGDHVELFVRYLQMFTIEEEQRFK